MTGRVEWVARCRVQVDGGPWPVAHRFAREIAAHWREAQACNPHMFNGQVYILREHEISSAGLVARVSRVTFAAYLYWRETGCDAHALNPFASVVVRAAGGGVLFGLAAAHTINGGRACLPGGFFDPRDETADGLLDVDRAGARELLEETGLDHHTLAREDGYWLAITRRELAIGLVYRARCDAHALVAAAHGHAVREAQPEMARFAVCDGARRGGGANPGDAAAWPKVPFAQMLLDHLDV